MPRPVAFMTASTTPRSRAGEIPLRTVTLTPVPDERLRQGVATSGVVLGYKRPGW